MPGDGLTPVTTDDSGMPLYLSHCHITHTHTHTHTQAQTHTHLAVGALQALLQRIVGDTSSYIVNAGCF